MYEPQTWANDDPSTPLSAQRLNHIEQGLVDGDLTNPASAARVAGDAVYVTFQDTDGNPLSGKHVIITVDPTTFEIEDITAEDI